VGVATRGRRGRVPAVSGPQATVVIVTKNRREDVLRAVGSAVAQRPPVEVLILDDGSSDGTAEAVRGAYPEARVVRFDDSKGYIVRRNEAASLASAPVLVSIDDDAELPSGDIVAVTVAEFAEPRIGAVAIPYVDLPDETVVQRAPAEDGVHVVHRFRGTAYAVRRDIFVELGGFRTMLFHQAEEADFCLRLLEAGYVVRLGRAVPIRHYGSPTRDLERTWFYECRNDILFAWHNVPMPDLLMRLLKTTIHMLWLGRGVRRTGLFARGLMSGAAAVISDRSARRPVRRDIWRLYERLGRGPAGLEDVRACLESSARSRSAAT
jgi:GT2 family glycosyltransferase